MRWENRPVLITGASGFIGSHLTERLLRQGARVRAMAHGSGTGCERFLVQCPDKLRENLEIWRGDVCDKAFVASAVDAIDTVFHLAAVTSVQYSYRHPEEAFRTNVLGTFNICEATLAARVRRVVLASSGGEYGNAGDRERVTEEDPLMGCNPYTASKIGADRCGESFHFSYGLPVSICRIFNTYGPRIGQFLVMPTIITQLAESERIKLGDLRPRRNFTYVDDIVTGFVRMAEEDAVVGKVVHFGSETAVSVHDLVHMIANLMDKNVDIVTEESCLRPSASEIRCTIPNLTRARELLGWNPKVDLEHGLRETINWIITGGYREIKASQII